MIWAWMKPLASSAVHHVRGRLDVGAGFGLHDRLLDQGFQRFVVLDVTVAHDAVMAVAVERVERHVADDADARHVLLRRGDGAADQSVGIVGLARVGRLLGGIGLGKDGDGRDAEIARLFGGLDEEVDRQAIDAGHRFDGCAGVGALLHEHRPDQVIDRKPGLGHQPARPLFAAVAAQPRRRIAAQGRKAFPHGARL
jgi:hypothetical protein